MSEYNKYLKKVVKKSLSRINGKQASEIKDNILSLITDLSHDQRTKLDTLSKVLVKAYLENKPLFYSVITAIFDFLRNNPSIDLFSLMLKHKKFNTANLSSIFLRLMDEGVLSVFDIKEFLPKHSSDTIKVSFLSRLLRKAQPGVMEDIILDALVDIIMPGTMEEMFNPLAMSPEFLGSIMGTVQILQVLYKKGYPVELIIQKIGEKGGPQQVLFIMMMLLQAGMSNLEVEDIVEKIDNPTFTQMFDQARNIMESMLPPGMTPNSMAGGQPGRQPGQGGARGNPLGNPLVQKLYMRLFKLFGRLRKF
ncbi:MAG: hypothetical protein ACTSUE_10965 [Promethearchaeota archaeon]